MSFWNWLTKAEETPQVAFAEPEPALPSLPALASAQDVQVDIRVEAKREDEPAFRRCYSTAIARGIRVEVDCWTSCERRACWGTLRQPNGKYVLFDPHEVADKILDPVLVPEVEAACGRMLKIDGDFLRSKPSEFVDKRGRVWRLAA